MDDLRAAGEQQVEAKARARAAACLRPRGLTLCLGLLGVLSAVACQAPSAGSAPTAASGAPVTVTIGVPQSRQIDPGHGAPAIAQFLAFERLTANDTEGRTRPRLLESWSIAADGLTWELHVRPDVRFQDGAQMTAADVKRTFDTAIGNPAIRGISVCLPFIKGVDVLTDRDVAVRLTRRCAYLLDDLDRAVRRTPPSGAPPIGTGPFSITSSTPDAITLDANRHHYSGRPAIDRVVVKPFDALRTAWAEMMRGRVDFLWEVGPDTAEFLSDRATVEVRSFPGHYAYALMLNSARPVFRPSGVRRALNLAVDRPALVQQGLRGRGLAADGPVWPNYWAHDRRAAPMPFDPGEAARGLRAAWPRPIAFTCLVPANFAILERMALLVQRQFGDLGIRVRLESLPPDAFNRRLASGEFDAAIISVLGGPSATVFHRLWHSPGDTPRWNFWGYRNAQVDAALDAALGAADDAQFRAAIGRFEAAARDDPPAVFLAWNETVQAVSRRFVVPADSAGRDAAYVLNRWLLRPPGSAAP